MPKGLDIDFSQIIGQGAHCKVFEACYFDSPCVVKQYSVTTTKPLLTLEKALVETHPSFQAIGAFLREVTFYNKVHSLNLANPSLLAYLGAYFSAESQTSAGNSSATMFKANYSPKT